MHTITRLLVAGLAAVAVLAAASLTASARRLSVSEDDFSATWEALTFRATGFEAPCPVTLSGSFHSRTIAKVNNAQIGSIASATIGTCTGDRTATLLRETLPWSVNYDAFLGLLPNLSGVRIEVTGFAMRVSDGVSCLFTSETGEPIGALATVDTATGQVDNIAADPNYLIDLDNPSFVCDLAGNGSFSGTGTVAIPRTEGTSTIEFTPASEIELDSLHEVTFTGGELRMTCEWTLRGSLTRGAIRRTEGAAVGSISSASNDHCDGGRVERVLSTPWDLHYVRATGTIPGSVTAVTLKVEGFAVDLKTFGTNVGCLYRGDLTGTFDASGANPYPAGLWRLDEPRLSFVSGARGCPESITASGTYWLGPEQEIRFVETEGSTAGLLFIDLI